MAELFDVPKIGINPGHEACVEEIRAAHKELKYNKIESPKSRGRTSKSHRTSFTITDDMFKRKESYEQPMDIKMRSGRKFSQVIPARKDSVMLGTISKKVDSNKNNFDWID